LKHKRRSNVFAAVAVAFALAALVVGFAAFEANKDRWHQGPTLLVISPGHGLHEMDLLLLGLALALAVLGCMSAWRSKR
jgi:hypothetical protein